MLIVRQKNIFKKVILLGAILLFSTVSLRAQQPYIPFRHLTNSDGLSQNHIFSILQDKHGFMWFGTFEGLNRYDGYDFTVYLNNQKDSTSLPEDNASNIIEDSRGDLWIGTGNGLCRFNNASNSFSTIKYDPRNPSGISKGRISKILEDKHGNLWLAFSSGALNYFDVQKKTFEKIKLLPGENESKDPVEATRLLLDRDQNLWIGTHKGIAVIDSTHHIIRHHGARPEVTDSLSSGVINDLFLDSEENIWIATNLGLNLFNPAQKNFSRIVHEDDNPNSLSINVIKCINEDKEGRLWIGTENGGLDIFDKSEKKFYHYQQNDAEETSLNDNSIYCIYRDHQDNMWVGTKSKGINFFDRRVKPFIVYHRNPDAPSSISVNKVIAVTEQPGSGYWIATDGGGLNFFDSGRGIFKTYRHDTNNKQSLSTDHIIDVEWDIKDHCLWIASWGGGLMRFDPATQHFTYFRHQQQDPSSLASDNLWQLHLDNAGTLYVGTVGEGMSILNKQTGKFRNIRPEEGLSERNVVAIHRDSGGDLWLGSWGNGLTRFDPATNRFLPLPNGITMKTVVSIFEDDNGRLWFSGRGPGLQSYDRKTETVHSYTLEEGVTASLINGVLEDKKGNLWLSSNKGIIKYNLKEKRSRAFGVEDGLPTNQFASRLMLASDGRMFFPSADGLVVFHPDSIKINNYVPQVILTDLKIFNRSILSTDPSRILSKPISETKSIKLPASYNFITLSFVALNYTSSHRNQYAYKLEGFDKDWIYVGSQRAATYTSLDPGNYTFRVKASNNDGVWNERGVSLVIRVMPPWWQTFWFRGMMLIGIVAGVFLFMKLRIRSIEKQNKKLNILVGERTRELNVLNKEVSNQNKILLAHEAELGTKNKILQQRQEEIEAQNEELRLNQEEISAQRDQLSEQNHKLENAAEIIQNQNTEITKRNENLEEEIKSRTKELVAYNQQLEQFAFISAHNLRAPVARILGLGKLLELEPKDSDEKKVIYEKMVFTASELDRVVRDLNTILEIKKNNTSEITDIRLDEVLVLVKNHIEKEIQDTQCEIITDFSQAPLIQSVRPYVESIILNLLSNAIKYRHPDRIPMITITSGHHDPYIVLTVVDNGLGIDTTRYKDKIFSLYQRFHQHVEGKGLGLYLIKTQIAALGGKIEIESKVDEGTTFRVYFRNQ